MANKGRSTIGETNINAALTDAAIVDILEGIDSNKYKSITEIMDVYNVSRPTIHRIFTESWTHITCNYPNLQELFIKVKKRK
jgi:DNA invertase Pin-like site-specific DNA recombinase